MDGKRIEGIGKKTIRMSNPEGGLGCPRYYEGQYDLEGDGRLRPFQFARLVRTDDDGVPEEAQPGLGDLVVSIYTYEDITEGKWDVAIRRAYKETLSKPLEGAVVHERTKRKMESCIKFGEPRDTAAAPVLGQENPLDGNEKMGYTNARKIGDVVFKYRSMDILLAEGIARRPDPALEAVQGGGSSIPFSLPLPLLSQLAEPSSSSAAAVSMGKPGDPRLKPPRRKDTRNVEAPKVPSPSSSKLGPPPSEASTSGVQHISPPNHRASSTQSGSRSGSSLSAVPPPLSSTPELRRSESINANTNSSVPPSPPKPAESGKRKSSKLPSALSSPPPKCTVVKSESVVKKEEEPESSDDLEEMSTAELNALKARAAALEELAATNALIADIEAKKRKRRSESSARLLDSKPVKEERSEAGMTVLPPSGAVIDLTDLDMEARKRKRRSKSSTKPLESKRVKKERKTELNFHPGEVIDLT